MVTPLFALRRRVADERLFCEMRPPASQCSLSPQAQCKRAGPGTSSGYEEKQETQSRQSVEGSSLQSVFIQPAQQHLSFVVDSRESQTTKTNKEGQRLFLIFFVI